MLKFDNKLYSELPKSAPERAHYEKCMSYLDETIKFPIYLKFTPDKIRKPDPNDASDKPEYSTGTILPLEANAFISGSIVTVRQYKRKIVRDGKEAGYDPKVFDLNENKAFDNTAENRELLYFLIFISPHCRRIADKKGLALQMNAENRRAHFYMEERAVEAQQNFNVKKLESDVRTAIYSSDLAAEPQLLRNLASVYGIPASLTLLDTEISVALENKVLQQSKNMTVDKRLAYMQQFLDDTKQGPAIRIHASVLKAIATKVVAPFQGDGGRLAWCYTDEDNNKSDEICTVTKLNDKPASLVDYFTKNDAAYEQFLRALDPQSVEV